MATHHGKEGVVTVGGTAVGELTSFTLETTGDVVEDTALTDGTKSFVAGRTSFSGTLEMHFDESKYTTRSFDCWCFYLICFITRR
jgi:hypothetical protein